MSPLSDIPDCYLEDLQEAAAASGGVSLVHTTVEVSPVAWLAWGGGGCCGPSAPPNSAPLPAAQ